MDEDDLGPQTFGLAPDMVQVRRDMAARYAPKGKVAFKLIQHYLMSYSSPYEASEVAGDDTLVCVSKGLATEVYKADELLVALEKCASTDDIRVVLEEGGLAL